LFQVRATNRESNGEVNDGILSCLGDAIFNYLWLFAVDSGDGFTENDRGGIKAFDRRQGDFNRRERRGHRVRVEERG